MDKKQVKQRIESLKKLINRHRYLYHVEDRQEISDEAFDSLKHELYKLEQEYPEFVSLDSPTQRVGGKPLEKFKKVKHKFPMLSLEDIFSEKELSDWEKYLKKIQTSFQFEYFTELKIDGFAVSLIYKNGVFILGSTRGDGKTGENVTQNLRTIESIPLQLKAKLPAEVEVRGEVYIEKLDFEKLNKELKKKGKTAYSNPRNLAAGSIRQLDPKLAASRPLKFSAYDLIVDFGQEKHSQEHEILKKLGFKTDDGKICRNVSEIVDYWKEAVEKREKLSYQIDGIVINVNDNFLFEKLGIAGKSPRGARAFKFFPKQATTKVVDIKLQVGRTGAVTPVVILKPVEISGVTITRASLHNEDEIKRLNVRIGDTVIVERAGDVIPNVAKVLSELRTGKEKEFYFPKICPVCSSKLKKPSKEAIWRCVNLKCPARKRKNIHFFVSQKSFNIEGLGPKVVDKLLNENLISNPADIFTLQEGDLAPLEKFAEKSAKNLIKAINKSKKIQLSRFILSLGIRHVGEETAVDLADYFGDIAKLQEAKKEDLELIADIGPKTAESIYNWFRSEQKQKFIKSLIKAGVEILPPEKTGKKFEGKTFVLTGKLENLTRSEAERKIRFLGGHPASAVSKETDYLIIGKEPGSKLEKAKKLGLKIIREKEFLEMTE